MLSESLVPQGLLPSVSSGFHEFSLSEPLFKALQDVGYETPSPIQSQIIPHLLAGRDVFGQAQTGTGKTAAFALPLLSRLALERAEHQVLVLTPTRELALQVTEAFRRYGAYLEDFRIVPVYGGQAYEGQIRQFKRGAHVVVGTPGRIKDHLERGKLHLENIQCLVLDEADEMLRMGFIEDVEWILEQTPSERQVALFSATVPPSIRKIAQKYLKNPVEVSIASHIKSPETISQYYWIVQGLHKLDALTRLLEYETTDGVLIFVRTKNATIELSENLEARGYRSLPLNGDIAQKMRENAPSNSLIR
jgi:ATP-dependent RNA helicase DeaD